MSKATKNKTGKDTAKNPTIALNKRAKHEYHLEQRYEAGLSLQGWELKAIRAGRANIGESYALIKNGEIFLFGARITPLIGLLGTVLGLMDVLLAARRAAPLVQSADLTGGLWNALSATALSLVIAILAYAGYNLLVSRVESILLDMERSASALLNFMRQWKRNRESPKT